MAIEQLNDDDWEPQMRSLPTLHSDFASSITCTRGEYTWTAERVKSHLNDVRRNLTDMIRKYELSGNGANQAIHNNSDNEIDAGEEREERRGHFNAERAQRVAARRKETSDGDDRALFLRHLPTDYLYTWDRGCIALV